MKNDWGGNQIPPRCISATFGFSKRARNSNGVRSLRHALVLVATSLIVGSCTAALDSGAPPGQTPSSLGYVTLDIDAQPISLQEDVREPAGFSVRVLPEYPREAFEAGIGGFVSVHVFVDSNGWPHEIEIVRSIPLLDPAVVTAVQRSSYRPARDSNGEPVDSWVAIIARFEPR